MFTTDTPLAQEFSIDSRELDGLLAALRQAGVVCLKAVLTPDNRSWTPGRLYRELQREHRVMGRG